MWAWETQALLHLLTSFSPIGVQILSFPPLLFGLASSLPQTQKHSTPPAPRLSARPVQLPGLCSMLLHMTERPRNKRIIVVEYILSATIYFAWATRVASVYIRRRAGADQLRRNALLSFPILPITTFQRPVS